MKHSFRQIPFYFLRHGETDHNVNKIYEDFTEVHLNENGKRQAYAVQNIFRSTTISTVCTSPLLRVQQTREIVLENKIIRNNIILDDLKECPGALWHLFLAAENGEERLILFCYSAHLFYLYGFLLYQMNTVLWHMHWQQYSFLVQG